MVKGPEVGIRPPTSNPLSYMANISLLSFTVSKLQPSIESFTILVNCVLFHCNHIHSRESLSPAHLVLDCRRHLRYRSKHVAHDSRSNTCHHCRAYKTRQPAYYICYKAFSPRLQCDFFTTIFTGADNSLTSVRADVDIYTMIFLHIIEEVTNSTATVLTNYFLFFAERFFNETRHRSSFLGRG